MCGKKWGGFAPSWGAMSAAVAEAFAYLNAGVRKNYRGAGDTASAARCRTAREAGITPAQADRLWKRWRTMASVDGDVYRALRNTYANLCDRNEAAADAYRAERLRLKAEKNETDTERRQAPQGRNAALD